MYRNYDAPDVESGRSMDDVFDALAGRRRRETLALLRRRDGELSESDLATLLVAERKSKPLLDVTDSEHQRVATRLHHVDLPKLADADLVHRDEARGTVSLGRLGAAGPILDAIDETASPDAVDEVLSALASERRRVALSVLREAAELDPAELAERVARREAGTSEDDDEIASVLASLRHRHLPKLVSAGLVDREEADGTDGERRAVSFDGRPAFDAEWLRVADEQNDADESR